MLKKSKKKKDVPKSLKGDQSFGGLERAKAIKFFKVKKNKNGKFTFIHYKEIDVKELLEKIFNKKCAYCESIYGAVSIFDVEHYRPKAEIEEYMTKTKFKPGYYWLAWDWFNLFPSCENCNRRINRKIWNEPNSRLSGKGNLFPIENEKNRAKKPGEESNERPLLLNPCVDYPEQHLDFTDDGLVKPKIIKGKESEKGKISIDIYGLLREDLVYSRKSILKSLEARIKNIIEYDRESQTAPRNSFLLKKLDDEINELKDYLKEESPYTAMSKQIIKEKLGNIL